MTLSPNLNNVLTNLDLPKKCFGCKIVYQNIVENFFVRKKSKDGYSSKCKKCETQQSIEYARTEIGYLTVCYSSIKNRYKNVRYRSLSEKEKEPHRCNITKKEFFELWEEHKKNFGYRCRLTEIKIILERAVDNKKRRFAGYSNAMSVDRLNPLIGYTKENIIFVSNEANKIKSGVTKDICIKVLKLYEEKGL